MNVIQLEIASSDYSSELTSLVADVTSGREVGAENSWFESFFYSDVRDGHEACIAIHERFLADWIFTDEDTIDKLDCGEEDITDQARLAHAREQLGELNDARFPDSDAPSIFFVDLLDGGRRCCSLIIGIIPAGQLGLITTLESAFLQGDHLTELANTGFLDINKLGGLEDQWILDRWTRGN